MKLYQYRQMYMRNRQWPQASLTTPYQHKYLHKLLVGSILEGVIIIYVVTKIPRIFGIPASLRSHLRSWNFRQGVSAKLRPRPDESDDSDDHNAPVGDLGGWGWTELRGTQHGRVEDTQQTQLLTQDPVSKEKNRFWMWPFSISTPREKNARDHFFLGGDWRRGHGSAVLLLHHRVEGVGVMSWGKLESFGSHPTRRR